jgi:hypothetical protein
MESSLSISFASPEISVLSDVLKIVQKPWESKTGLLTKAKFYTAVNSLLQGSIFENPIDCGFNSDGSLTSTIYVYLEDSDFPYVLKTSYGVLGSKYGENAAHEEIIQFSYGDSSTLEFSPKTGSVSYSWIGDVYDYDGNIISEPTVSINEKTVALSSKVYGSLKVNYTAFRHVYTLTAYPREDTEENIFSAVVYALYEGGIEWLSLTEPPNADDIALNSNCGWPSYSSELEGEDDTFEVPKVYQSDVTYYINYCTQEIESIIFSDDQGMVTKVITFED